MRIHILGICGTMTTPLALALVSQGHVVSGSDQTKIYPPFSTELTRAGITVNETRIDSKIDLAIIGSSFKSFKNCIAEFDEIKKISLKYISATNYIAQNVVKKDSILIAGSHGKTTISSILAWLNPSSNYFFGGMAVNDNFPSLKISDSNWSIVEADESINGLDSQAKFLYFPTKYVILTSARWEHKESYKTEADNLTTFKKLLENIPKDGLLVYNPKDTNISKILPFCMAKKVPYRHFSVETKLIGLHNRENIDAALTLCQELKFDYSTLPQFLGVKRRLEVVSETNDVLYIDDYAQSSNRVKSALEAIKYTFPNRRIFVYFEPQATFLQNQKSVEEFNQIKDLYYSFILGKIKFSKDKENRVTAKNWQKVLDKALQYFPVDNDIVSYFISTLKPKDILVHFSSGGLDGLNNLKKVYNGYQ